MEGRMGRYKDYHREPKRGGYDDEPAWPKVDRVIA